MSFALWCVVAGAVLIFMALASSVLERLPLSTSMLYLALGAVLGSSLVGAIDLDAIDDAPLFERLTEVAVLVSLFSAGLKLRMPLTNWRWTLPVRLATVSMVVTVGAVAVLTYYLLALPVGAAILLGAILAPTDPVLASDVQVSDAYDRDHLRFGLTGEAGLNDGTAFPFVMLGLGLLGLHDIGRMGQRWVAVDLVWAVASGIAVGALLGWCIAHLVLYMRRHHREAVGLDDFLALGLIAISYGIALTVNGYGFLAVFAAGVSLRRVEMKQSHDGVTRDSVAALHPEAATDPATAPAYMARAVLAFNEQMERAIEVVIVVVIGSLLSTVALSWTIAVTVIALLFVIRPISALAGMAGSDIAPVRKMLVAWFGIRGVGSLYYLAYAITHGLPGEYVDILVNVTLTVIATSVVLHGVSVTPLMSAYGRYKARRRAGR
ncbi:MAG: cation:proton antiporter [Rhodospirillaceae bacterium]